ncbi:MAG: hypothetical protein HGA27_07550 [Peptococcaceae bacterium]|nr:hypothetical protein [Peptococcaceae bacterium]
MYAGKPKELEDYNEITTDDLTVYLPKSAVTKPDGIRLILKSWGIWHDLQVEGLLQ